MGDILREVNDRSGARRFFSMRRLALLTACAGAPFAAEAGEGLALSGSVRARYEAIDGQLRPGFNDSDDLFSLRSMLLAEYGLGPLRFGAEISDSRVWLADAGTPVTNNEVNVAELVQAYAIADFREPLGPKSGLKLQVGRFKMDLGSRRLVASPDDKNTWNAYTGLRADVKAGEAEATLIYVLPQVRLPDDFASLRANRRRFDRESFDLRLHGGIGSLRLAGGGVVQISAYRLTERDQPDLATRDRRLMTIGARALREPGAGAFDHDIEVFHQFGSLSASAATTAPKLDAAAWFVHAHFGRSWEGAWKPRLAVELDYASGDGPGGRYGRFDTLFGARRGEFGPSGIYSEIGRANIIAPGVRFEAAPHGRIDAFVAYKSLFLASARDSFSTTGLRDPAGASGQFAGHQIDSRLRVWIVPKTLRFETNLTYVVHGDFIEAAPNGRAGSATRYASFSLTGSF